jgi:hypothetical protein
MPHSKMSARATHSKRAMMDAGGGKCIRRMDKNLCWPTLRMLCRAFSSKSSRIERVHSMRRWRVLHPIPGSPPTALITQYSLRPLKIVRDHSSWSLEVVWVVGPAFWSSSDEGRVADDVPASGLAAGPCPIWHPCHLESGKFQKADSTCQFQGALTGLRWTVSGIKLPQAGTDDNRGARRASRTQTSVARRAERT